MLIHCILITFELCSEYSNAFLPPSHRVATNLDDEKTFTIVFNDDNDDEESQNEMIQPQDLINESELNVNDNRYIPLHNFVKHYNHQAAIEAIQTREISKNVSYILPEERNNDYLELRPFFAGFKEELNKLNFEELNEERDSKIIKKLKNSSMQSSINRVRKNHQRQVPSLLFIKSNNNNNDNDTNEISSLEEVTEEAYDYESLKAEYEQQIKDSMDKNQTFNYTDKGHPEDTPKEVIKQIFEYKKPKNCTEEEFKKFGLKAFECLTFDYQHSEKKKNFMILLSRTWTVLKIWIMIYLIFAIPCWCYKGWCCCCFRFNFCLPNRRILNAKSYYVHNPPGVSTEQPYSKKMPLEYKPTLLELDAYEKFEFAIKKL